MDIWWPVFTFLWLCFLWLVLAFPMFILFLFRNISKEIGRNFHLPKRTFGAQRNNCTALVDYFLFVLLSVQYFFLIQLIFYSKSTFEIEFLSILLVPFQVYGIKPFSFAEKFINVMSVMLSVLAVVSLNIMKLLENQNINLKMPVLK